LPQKIPAVAGQVPLGGNRLGGSVIGYYTDKHFAVNTNLHKISVVFYV
jgi:hypothetical protein